MKTRVSKTAACAFSCAVEYAERFLARQTGSAAVQSAFQVIDDATDTTRRHEALSMSWLELMPQGAASFQGLLTVRPVSGKTMVTLEGEVTDTSTALALLEKLVAHLEAEWRAFVRASPTVSMCNERNRAGASPAVPAATAQR